ncbi:hypothetical protein MSIBF_A1220005 [groundwater metagenome]|uniref:Uncharacterized protein n=1 Tax=groundwater metagenome TaxID=717931 RepID=A0A098E6S1_9ZZZZ
MPNGKNFAYGASSSHIITYNGETNLKTGNKILGGSPLSCELNGENLAVCTQARFMFWTDKEISDGAKM